MSSRRTRAKNATTHPGAIVLAAQGKRRTKAEKQADDNHAAAERAAAEQAEQERVVTIAKMVMELRAKEQNAAAPGPEVPEKASGAKRTKSRPNSIAMSGNGAAVEQGSKDQTPSDTQVAATSAKPKRAPKPSLKAMIGEASKTITDSTDSGSADKPGNMSQYLKKQTLSGTIKDWASVVREKTLPKGPSPPAKANPIIKGSMISALSSQFTKVNSVPATTTTQYSEMDAGITTKFGGFDLSSEDGDYEEQSMKHPKHREGKLSDNIVQIMEILNCHVIRDCSPRSRKRC
ncbi:hypothetical protein L210DRAFT_3508032 [Boletus edulis BED1]|uniref:Uncharacterized protein n=1 Tax=Boletus edulis BED1 TaxID=1328754 RepID=A0AAD4G8V2_BOLED|nr:hypothetical protein L210DRAFT_3508032 [Boletus edulis BED1]